MDCRIFLCSPFIRMLRKEGYGLDPKVCPTWPQSLVKGTKWEPIVTTI